jgi:alginate O-acetyltransferase complex protein AlgI
MNLDSLEFVFLFLPCLLILNFILPQKYRHFLISLSSILFFFLLQPQMLPVLLIFTSCDYVFGYVLSKTQNAIFKKIILAFSLVFNLAVFVLSQYSNMIPFIIGVAVISLVKITYIFSIYSGKITSTDNIFVYLANVLCFPTSIAGPINDYAEIGFNIRNNQKSLSKFGKGACEFVYGLFKKVVIADNISALLLNIAPDNSIPKDSLGAILWVSCNLFVLTYTIMGYSQMARGVCKMLGFDVISNFNFPFMATSVKEFFKRFNTSLSLFCKKYIYIPFGGSHNGKLCMITSTLLATLLGTLWYGFSLNTVLCALYFAVIIILEKLLSTGKKGPKIVLNLFTLITLLPGYLLLITKTPGEFSYLVSSLLGLNQVRFMSENTLYYLNNYAVFLFLAVVLLFDFGKRISKRYSHSTKIYSGVLVSLFNVFLLAISTAFML